MLLSFAATLLVPLFTWFSSNEEPYDRNLHGVKDVDALPAPLQLELRHLHAVDPFSARVVFSDVSRDAIRTLSNLNSNDPSMSTKPSYTIHPRRTKTYKPSSFAAHAQARMRSLHFGENEKLDWEEDEIEGPDVEKRETLLELAKMTNNAYVEPEDPAWYDLNGRWNISLPFGWEPESDGFRGHVFATPDNKTVVISIKGTSAGLFGGGGSTAKKDKLNDNLLFSCCCARVDWTWTTVCGCYRGGWKCDQSCLEDALITDSLFYPIGTNLYNNVTYMFPEANIWMIGHSLGGALASLVGITFGVPVVTFESPGERLAATRLHLPSPPSTHHVTHIWHTADPIAMGTCNGVLSSCALGGYAMETACHLGKTIVYDTVSNASWSVDVRSHGIVNVIERLLADPWPPSVEEGREVPKPVPQNDCVECFSWEFVDFDN